ncbi:MAG TPA: hypothetical protein VJR47_06560 [Stellaceae bacterium]|nr:hypothetical protein [Stellaceae bacterium]
MASFQKSFWRSFLAIAAILAFPLILWSRVNASHLPPKPALPIPGQRFVAEYGGQGAYIAHLVYWWNLFGIGDRLRHADLVLLGSSHTQFGLSARQLSDDLSHELGRPVAAFNAGLGCDTPLRFDASLIERLGIRDRVVVADSFAYEPDPYTYGCFADFSGIGDPVQAGFKTIAVWSRFAWDWMLDGVLPRIDLRGGRIVAGRYINEAVTMLDWKNGDVAELFNPAAGEEFPQDRTRRPEAIAQGLPWRLDSGSIPLPPSFDAVERLGVHPIFTLIPYVLSPGFNEDRFQRVEGLLASRSAASRAPFIAIAPDGLASFDGQHLTGGARAKATARIETAVEARLSPAFSQR